MAHSLTWLPEVLTQAGLKVSTVQGWENRGRGNVGRIFGVICHHTANGNPGNMPSLALLRDGRSDLRGPLAQLGLGRDGAYVVIAAGRANHAGRGRFRFPGNITVVNGNSNLIGIEAEHSGSESDPWPDVQLDAYRRGVAAILKHLGRPREFCIAHREWTTRKPDPRFDMNDFRAEVGRIMDGAAPARLIPGVEPAAQAEGRAPRPTLRRGMTGELTRLVQGKVGVTPNGHFGPRTEAAVRAFQRPRDLVPDGIVGPKTWLELDKV